MKGIKRVIDTSFWLDNKVLDFSAEDKYFMLFLLCNLYTTQLGIYYFPIKRVAIDMGYSEDTIKVLLERFENKYHIIEYSTDTSEILIKNYLRHSIMKGGKPVKDCLEQEESNIKNTQLLVDLYNHLSKYMNDKNFNVTVREYLIHIQETYITNDNDNDNDNDNERIVDESWTNRGDEPQKDDFFEEFWQNYPRKDAKGGAYKKYIARINSGYTHEELLIACKNYAEECKAEKRDKKYIKMGQTFLSDSTPFVDYLGKENDNGRTVKDDKGYRAEDFYGGHTFEDFGVTGDEECLF